MSPLPPLRRFAFGLLLLSIFIRCADAVSVELPLTLAPVSSEVNRLNFFATAFGLSDGDSTDLSGSIDASIDLALSPFGAEVIGLRFDGGQIDATDIDLDFTALFVPVASVDGRNLGAEVSTPAPGFGAVAGGVFATEDHVLLINRGTLTGGGLASDLSFDLAAEPFELTQVGTGTIAIQEVSASGRQRTFGATVTLPIDGEEALTDPPATIEVDGTVMAIGQFTVELPLPGDFNGDGVVDAADFSTWRDRYSAGAETVAGYELWRANFGAGSGGGAAGVPEPAAACLLLGLLLGGGRSPRG